MNKYDIILRYYDAIVAIVRPSLPNVPAAQLTDATSYYGSAYRRKGGGPVHAISLSAKRLYPVDPDKLIETVCHELAHTIIWEHGVLHTRLTEEFKKLAKRHLKEELAYAERVSALRRRRWRDCPVAAGYSLAETL